MESDAPIRIKEPDDPNRCQAMGKRGQCELVALPETQYCKIHGGKAQSERLEKEKIKKYQLGKWNARIQQLSGDGDVKCLRDEIGVLRMMIEEILGAITSPTDLLIQAPQIANLVTSVERLVISMDKLEKSTGALLDKPAILRFAGQFVDIVAEELPNPDDADRICARIIEMMNDE